jgi:hypothetical protein
VRRQFAGNDGSAAAEVDAVLPERPWETMKNPIKQQPYPFMKMGAAALPFIRKPSVECKLVKKRENLN